MLSRSKLLSGASAQFDGGAAPNSRCALHDAGLPGTLPRVNAACVEAAVRTGLALGAQVRTRSVFERKHYFYGDQPLGFQVTQQRWPIAVGGALSVSFVEDRGLSRAAQEARHALVRITRVQLEQDTGRSLESGAGSTLVDLNRAGCGVMEIVTEPDVDSAAGAVAFCAEMRALLEAVGTCDGNMQDGSLRFDVNVSVHGGAHGVDSHRVEVKNLNSFRSVERAVRHEQQRLERLYEAGSGSGAAGAWRGAHETRTFNIATGGTEPLRSKDSTAEYRFFPEPDLPPLVISQRRIEALRATMPELPEQARARLQQQLALPEDSARKLLEEPGALRLLDAAVKLGAPAQAAAGWILNDLLALAHAQALTVLDMDLLTPDALAAVIRLEAEGAVTRANARKALAETSRTGRRPEDVIRENDWAQLQGAPAHAELAAQVLDELAARPKGREQLAQYHAGKASVLEFILGAAMQRSKGRANAQLLRPALLDALLRHRPG